MNLGLAPTGFATSHRFADNCAPDSFAARGQAATASGPKKKHTPKKPDEHPFHKMIREAKEKQDAQKLAAKEKSLRAEAAATQDESQSDGPDEAEEVQDAEFSEASPVATTQDPDQ